VKSQGFPGATVSGRRFGSLGERISNAQRGEIHRRCMRLAEETTPRVVGLVESEYFLATTGRCNRKWVGRRLEMTQDARDDRLLGDGGNNAE